eukprot:11202489-Ditylum_brightwellii.AAC.1
MEAEYATSFICLDYFLGCKDETHCLTSLDVCMWGFYTMHCPNDIIHFAVCQEFYYFWVKNERV